MCQSDKNLSYNDQVLKYAFDPTGFKMDTKCSCGKFATHHSYDRNDGGCINAYFSISCSHCGKHQCNDDFCSVCYEEENLQPSNEERLFTEEFVCLLDDIFFSFEKISAVKWTRFKEILTNHSDDLLVDFESIGCYRNRLSTMYYNEL